MEQNVFYLEEQEDGTYKTVFSDIVDKDFVMDTLDIDAEHIAIDMNGNWGSVIIGEIQVMKLERYIDGLIDGSEEQKELDKLKDELGEPGTRKYYFRW